MKFPWHCKWSVGHSRAHQLLERLETRRLLSAAAIDTSFGVGGYSMGYQALAARNDGSIIASKSASGPAPLALLAPNGSVISGYSGPVPQPPAQNVQSDGKVLKITGTRLSPYTSGNQLTRYNTNGTVDTSFGNAGTVVLTSTIANFRFYPNQVLVHGSQIYVSGLGNSTVDGLAGVGYVVVEAFNSNGTINRTFGQSGAVEVLAGAEYYGNPFDRIGPDGEIYVANDFDCRPMVWRFTTAGKLDGNFSGPEGGVDAAPVLGLAFARDQKILILAQNNELDLKLYRVNRNFAYDSTFGSGGHMSIVPPAGIDPSFGYQSNSGTLVLRDDGEILVGANFDPLIFTAAISPGAAAGTGAISGRFFNDINANHKQDAGEPDLAWWQAYADLNNNGIFDAGEPAAFANAAGEYTLNDLTPGKYLVREVRQNNWTRTTPAGNWPTGGLYKLTVSAGKTVTGANFGNSLANHAKGSISGTVFNDLNGDQKLDNQEPGLAAWQVYADVNDNGIYDSGEPIATANSKGQYTLSNLPVGGYRLREVRQNGWVRTSPPGNWPLGFYDVSLAAGQSLSGYNFGNAPVTSSATGRVFGYVYDDRNGNGTLDPGETGFSGVLLQLQIGAVALRTTTDANGFYSFGNISPGPLSYTIYVVEQFKYANLRGQTEFSGIIYAGQTLHDNLFLQPLST